MGGNMVQPAPNVTLRRLALYHSVLQRLQKDGREVVSCTRIGEELRFDPTQVRKDIEATGIVGKARIGYEVKALLVVIEEFLGWNNTREAFLVGAGSLGTALLGYERLKSLGLSIIAAFDTNPQKIGSTIHGVEVLPLEKLVDLSRRMLVLVGIITVPDESAQTVADLMVAGGMRAVWNFAPVSLAVPDGVVVEDVQIASSLAVLSKRLSRALALEKKGEDSDVGNAHAPAARGQKF
ncbi:MAG TPA: redox-sensing transcriptional repressor Rex [Magnetospirillaceae bacterium]|nr:redox-sensing transcriptional repressor Rex [Magnetospirillaceae bacterium]